MLILLLRKFFAFCKKQTLLTVFVLSLLYCFVLYINPDDFKSGIVISIIFTGLYYFSTGNIFTSAVLTFLMSAFFLFPAKTYTFEYAAAREYVYETIPNGIFENITLNISDVYGIFLLLYFVRERLQQWGDSSRNSLGALFSMPLNISILAAWFVYFAFTLFSSLYFSAYPVFSVNMLAHYGKMVVIFVSIIYLLSRKPANITIVSAALTGLLLFQSGLGSLQFAQNLTSFGSNTQLQNLDTEQGTFFSRVNIGGISMHANNHALAIAILMLLTLPFAVSFKGKYWWAVHILAGINIILTQSRTIWICFAVVVLFLHFSRRISLYRMYVALSVKARATVALVILLSISLIILPRFQVAGLFFGEDGGGTLRLRMLSEGWQILQQAPWTGFGAGMNVRIFMDLAPNGYIYTFPANPHITYLQLALESGIPAALCFLFPFGLILRKMFNLKPASQLHNAIRLSIVCSLIVLLIFFLVQPVYGRREFMYLGIMFGLAAHELNYKKEKNI